MFQNKKQIKITILFLVTVIFISQFSLFSLAQTEVYFSLSDNPQKAIIENINQAKAFINIAMYIFIDRGSVVLDRKVVREFLDEKLEEVKIPDDIFIRRTCRDFL